MVSGQAASTQLEIKAALGAVSIEFTGEPAQTFGCDRESPGDLACDLPARHHFCCCDVLLMFDRSDSQTTRMHKTKPPSLSLTSAIGPPAPNALDRVIAIAPAPLLPGEEEADYAEVAVRLVSAAKPRDAIEEFLIRDAIDLTWEILRLRRAKAGTLKASMNEALKGY